MTAALPPTPTSDLPAPGDHRPPTTVPGFAATFRSEWTKLWSAKGPRRNLVLGSVLGVAVSALLAFAVGSTFSEWGAADQAEFDPLLFSVTGTILTAIFFVAVGAKVVTSEYDSGMIRLTLTATPRRDRVLAAKALVVAIVTWAFGAVTMLGMVIACRLIFAGYDLETTSLLDADSVRMVGLVILFIPLFPVLAVVAGFLFRSTAPTLTTVLVLLFGPSMFGALFPRWWQENVLSLLPGSTTDALSIGHLTDSDMYHSTPVAAVVTILWIVVPLLVARADLMRRDA